MHAHTRKKEALRKTATLGVAMLVILTTGCTSQPDTSSSPVPTPEPEVNAYEQPCRDFEALTDDMATLIIDFWTKKSADGDADRLDAMPDEFDMLALSADGVIGERMATVTDLLQDTAPIVMSTKPDAYFDAIRAVQRACAAEDVEIGVATWK